MSEASKENEIVRMDQPSSEPKNEKKESAETVSIVGVKQSEETYEDSGPKQESVPNDGCTGACEVDSKEEELPGGIYVANIEKNTVDVYTAKSDPAPSPMDSVGVSEAQDMKEAAITFRAIAKDGAAIFSTKESEIIPSNAERIPAENIKIEMDESFMKRWPASEVESSDETYFKLP